MTNNNDFNTIVKRFSGVPLEIINVAEVDAVFYEIWF